MHPTSQPVLRTSRLTTCIRILPGMTTTGLSMAILVPVHHILVKQLKIIRRMGNLTNIVLNIILVCSVDYICTMKTFIYVFFIGVESKYRGYTASSLNELRLLPDRRRDRTLPTPSDQSPHTIYLYSSSLSLSYWRIATGFRQLIYSVVSVVFNCFDFGFSRVTQLPSVVQILEFNKL